MPCFKHLILFFFLDSEIATRGPHGLESDVWSLGCMLYTLIVGSPPFDVSWFDALCSCDILFRTLQCVLWFMYKDSIVYHKTCSPALTPNEFWELCIFIVNCGLFIMFQTEAVKSTLNRVVLADYDLPW